MKRIHVIGQKNSGKTTLIAELVQTFTELGYRVGTIKHTHHQHELDAPGKDSHRHREAGAKVVGILSQKMNAVFWPPEETAELSREQRYQSFAPMFASCDLVIVEGDSKTDQQKIEVWRAELGTVPLAANDASILAVVTDDKPEVDTPAWPRSEVTSIAKKILALR